MLWLTGLVFLLLLKILFFTPGIILRLIIIPTADFTRSGVMVHYFPRLHVVGESNGRQELPDINIKIEAPNTSALSASILHLEKKTEISFKLETDDFGKISIDNHSYADQSKKVSPYNATEFKAMLEAGDHFLVAELNNLQGAGKLCLKQWNNQKGEWQVLGESAKLHPVMLSNLPVWLKAIPYIRIICAACVGLLIICCYWFWRGWRIIGWFNSPNCKIAGVEPIKIVIYLLPFFITLYFIALKFWDPVAYSLAIHEDSSVENLQALFYFLAAVFCAFLAVKLHKNKMTFHSIMILLFGLACLFVSLEEISWGQRIFNISTPKEISQYNIQSEITVHNLGIINSIIKTVYMLIGLYGTIGWLLCWTLRIHKTNLARFYVPRFYLSSYFLIVFIVYAILGHTDLVINTLHLSKLQVGGDAFLGMRDEEPAELLLSMAFMLFPLSIYFDKLGGLTTQSTTARLLEIQPQYNTFS